MSKILRSKLFGLPFVNLGNKNINSLPKYLYSFNRHVHMTKNCNNPVNIKMPSLSPTMTDGSITKWAKKEGEEVLAGDVLCEVQTDKAVVALEAEDDGVMAKIIVPENKPNIPVGELIAVIASSGEDWNEVAAAVPTAAAASETVKKPQTDVQAEPGQPASSSDSPSQASMFGPAVRLLLQSHNLVASKIPATGPHGLLLKEDILSYIASQPDVKTAQPTPIEAAHAPASSAPFSPPVPTSSLYTDIPLTNMRMTIAKRLTQSKSTIPHAFVRSVATLDRLMALRKSLKADAGLKLSVNDMIIKACSIGLRLVPELNALTDPTGKMVFVKPNVDICMAVATPAGLITPILSNVDQTPISQIAQTAVALAKKARDGKLQPHEFQGGSFTISNLGMFGIREFTAIINPPQLAILAVGAGQPRATLDELQTVKFANQMTLTLSVDSRHVDDVMAGRFLTHVSRLLSDHPEWLLADDPTAMRVINRNSLSVPVSDGFDSLMLSTLAKDDVPIKEAVTQS